MVNIKLAGCISCEQLGEQRALIETGETGKIIHDEFFLLDFTKAYTSSGVVES